MLVDSHCHINFLELKKRISDVLTNMQNNQISHALVVSVSQESFFEIIDLVNEYQNLFGSIGIHPDNIDNIEFSLDEMLLHSKHPKIIGIGETGLDYHLCEGDLTWQKNRFTKHIEVSIRTGLPLIIHTRDAGLDTLDIMRAHQVKKAVIHCFTETREFAKQALDLGYYISFSGIVTFKNAKQIQEVCRYIPDDRLLVETDAPYLAPVPFRGKTNEPAYVKNTAEFIAALRNQRFETIAKMTTDNFFSLFEKAQDEKRISNE
ncbi:MAG: YchF/TatD family DNA exonuclease [Neisseriaceae bacterium]|nr:MAG: YchF/TatD family DNA exonuclease [Neisseriaceae bacterium]